MATEPLLVTAEEAAKLLSLGRSKIYLMMQAGELPGIVRIGRSVRISRIEIERWIAQQTGDGANDNDAHNSVREYGVRGGN